MQQKFIKKKKYQTPFIPPKGDFNSQRASKKKWVFFIIILFLLILLIYVIFYSPIFKIKRIKVEGTQNSQIVNELRQLVQAGKAGYIYGILPKDNLWLLNLNELAPIIKQQLNLEDLNLSKKMPGTLVVNLKVRKPVLIWNEGDIYYYIDQQGTVMGAKKFKEIKFDLPVVANATSTQIIVGRKILDSARVNFIKTVYAKADKKFKHWHIMRTVIGFPSKQIISFYTDQGWYFILDKPSNIDAALDNLNLLLKEKLTQPDKIEYIDLRLVDKIFYKLKN